MICFKCDSEKFVLRDDAIVEQEFKGETLQVRTPVMACEKCGWQALGPGQLDELRKRTADTYRQQHGLLTSSQIKAKRSSLKMSQRQFADFLRVGEASVKRWETWQVQDASSDELIRVKVEMKQLRATIANEALNIKLKLSSHEMKWLLSELDSYFTIQSPDLQSTLWNSAIAVSAAQPHAGMQLTDFKYQFWDDQTEQAEPCHSLPTTILPSAVSHPIHPRHDGLPPPPPCDKSRISFPTPPLNNFQKEALKKKCPNQNDDSTLAIAA